MLYDYIYKVLYWKLSQLMELSISCTAYKIQGGSYEKVYKNFTGGQCFLPDFSDGTGKGRIGGLLL